jgi:allatostatin A receptor
MEVLKFLIYLYLGVPFTAGDYALDWWQLGDFFSRCVSQKIYFNNNTILNLNPLLIIKVQYIIVVTCNASIYTIVMISFDRYLGKFEFALIKFLSFNEQSLYDFSAVVHPIASMSIRTVRNACL